MSTQRLRRLLWTSGRYIPYVAGAVVRLNGDVISLLGIAFKLHF